MASQRNELEAGRLEASWIIGSGTLSTPKHQPGSEQARSLRGPAVHHNAGMGVADQTSDIEAQGRSHLQCTTELGQGPQTGKEEKGEDRDAP